MRLKISHHTEYRYDFPIPYGLQRLRLVPQNGPTQTVASWELAIEGARDEVRFVDHFGNETRLVSMEGEPRVVAVEARGVVETTNANGVSGPHRGFTPLWLYGQATPLTEAGELIHALAAGVPEGNDIERLHRLMAAIAEQVAYVPGATDTATGAESALQLRSGVCQDHAQIFVSAARLMGFPARYVSGYLMMDATNEQAASHAWAEAHVDALGWLAFDVANHMSPDERYVRLAVGRDYKDATPVSGIRLGQALERLAVRITVEQ